MRSFAPPRQHPKKLSAQMAGISASLGSALFLGLAPVFGRQAILFGLPPLAVVAMRTAFAALLLLAVMFFFYRQFLFIYPAGLLGCVIAGWLNGLGSLFYYSALGRISASLGQMLYALYPLFLVIWLLLDRQKPSRLTILRLLLILPALALLTQTRSGPVDWIGVLQMLIASALYALHLPVNQRVLYEMPAPTVTLYTLLAMSAIVVPTYLFSGNAGALIEILQHQSALSAAGTPVALTRVLTPVLGLTLVTFFSRLTLFLGVKHLGGMQTALLGLSELLVTLLFSHLMLGESFSLLQWMGAGLLVISLGMVALEKTPAPQLSPGGFLSFLRPPGLPPDILPPHD